MFEVGYSSPHTDEHDDDRARGKFFYVWESPARSRERAVDIESGLTFSIAAAVPQCGLC